MIHDTATYNVPYKRGCSCVPHVTCLMNCAEHMQHIHVCICVSRMMKQMMVCIDGCVHVRLVRRRAIFCSGKSADCGHMDLCKPELALTYSLLTCEIFSFARNV